MVASSMSSFLFGMVILSMVSLSYQIKCHVCATSQLSKSYSPCPTNFTDASLTLKECPSSQGSCVRMEESTTGNLGSTENVVRACADEKEDNQRACKNATSTTKCSYCNNVDGCNGATSIAALTVLSFIGAVLAKLL